MPRSTNDTKVARIGLRARAQRLSRDEIRRRTRVPIDRRSAPEQDSGLQPSQSGGYRLNDFRPRQPYRIVLAGEKTSLRPVLEPIARRHLAELVLPTGEMSDTLIKGIADRAMADGRPCVVLYFADFDPSGWQMPISVARKLQALGDLMPGLPPIQVHRVGLLDTHVKAYGLPSCAPA